MICWAIVILTPPIYVGLLLLFIKCGFGNQGWNVFHYRKLMRKEVTPDWIFELKNLKKKHIDWYILQLDILC